MQRLLQTSYQLRMKTYKVVIELFPLALASYDNIYELFEDAEYDKSGKLSKLIIPWVRKNSAEHRFLSCEMMGYVVVQPLKLTLVANSSKRLREGSVLLARYLGDAIKPERAEMRTRKERFA